MKKGIANRLSSENWTIIDLTLKEFALPFTDNWSGTAETYVIEMIKGADDQTLMHLAEHLGLEDAGLGSLLTEATFWEQDKLRVFLSHISKHKVWATALQKSLAKLGIHAFVAHMDIKPTSEWQEQIDRALSSCDGLVALLHEGFHVSNWTDQEIGFAMGRGVPVFSVRLGEDPYGFIGKFQAFNGTNKEPWEIAEEIFTAYRTNKQTQFKMKEILLTLFEKSSTFANAKARIGYLEELETWGPTYADRIRAAAKSNFQIKESFDVPERVEKLATKWER